MLKKSLLGVAMVFILLAVLTPWKLSIHVVCVLLAAACFFGAARARPRSP